MLSLLRSDIGRKTGCVGKEVNELVSLRIYFSWVYRCVITQNYERKN